MERLQKAFWSAKLQLWLNPIKAGKPMPEGAKVIRGKQGGSYYYLPDDQPAAPQGVEGAHNRKIKLGAEEQDAQGAQNENAAPPLLVGGLVGEKENMELNPEQRNEQPWRLGKIAVKVPNVVPEHTRIKNGIEVKVAAHEGFRTQWMLPGKYVEGIESGEKWSLDNARNDEAGVRLPTPDDPARKHIHEGAMEPHKINEPHPHNPDADIGHRDEVARYDRIFNRRPQSDWIEQYEIKITPDVNIKLGGKNYQAQKYVVNGLQSPIYTFDTGLESFAVTSKEEGVKKFNRQSEATKYIQTLVSKYGKAPEQKVKEDWNAPEIDEEDEDLQNPQLQPLYAQKSVILNKAFEIISKAEDLQTTGFGEYSSGGNKITFNYINNKYIVKVNEHEVVSTDNIGEAISKFYQEISKLIQSQVSDKDIAMTLFGEKVIQTNRKAIPLLNGLGKSLEAIWLKNLDISNFTIPFNPDIIKYEPQNNVFPIVSTQDGNNQGISERGVKPSRDLEPYVKVSPTYQMTHKRTEQNPIVQKESFAINISKAFWSDKLKLWLNHIKPGERLPEGAVLLRGVQGGMYYYFPSGHHAAQKQGPQGEEAQFPKNVLPGHGVQGRGWRAEATRNAIAMAERNRIKRPWGEAAPRPANELIAEQNAVRQQNLQQPVREQQPETPIQRTPPDLRAQRLEMALRERERERMEQDAIRRANEVKKLEEENKKKEAEKQRKLQLQPILDKLIPQIQFKSPEHQAYFEKINQLPLDDLKKEDEKLNKNYKALNAVVEGVKTGELNDIAPELAQKLPQIQEKLNIISDSKKMPSTMSKIKELRGKYSNYIIKSNKKFELSEFQEKYFSNQAFSDPKIQHMLIDEITSNKKLTDNGGINEGKRKITYSDGSKAAFKAAKGEQDWLQDDRGIEYGGACKREAIAYQIDQILGFGVVPPTGYHYDLSSEDNNEGIGSIQEWKNGDVGANAQNGANTLKSERDMAAAMDMILGNSDRHGNNYIVDGQKIWLIDNGLTLGSVKMDLKHRISGSGRNISDEVINKVIEKKEKILAMLEASLGQEVAKNASLRMDTLIRQKSWLENPY